VAQQRFASTLVTTSVDAKAVLRSMSKLPKEVQAEIRSTNQENANRLVRKIKTEIGIGDPPQADLVRDSFESKRDRIIRVDAGGARQVGRRYRSKRKGRKYGAPAGALINGAEYGSSGKPQDRKGRTMGARFVRPHKAEGYFIGPAVREYAPWLLREWTNLIQTEIKKRGLK